MKRVASVVGVIVLLTSLARAAGVAAPTFQELMDPNLLSEPQCGMRVESATKKGNAISIVTTGAQISLLPDKGEVSFAQRIGHRRPVARLDLGRPMQGARITHSGPGLARVTFDRPKMTIRVNGDSLFMLHVHEPLTVSVHREFEPAWSDSYGANHLIVDEWGGFGLYCSRTNLDNRFDPYDETVAAYPLAANDVLWVGVCPPKPYDWDRSLRDNVVWHWSNKLGYPPDDVLRSWRSHGNIILLQSEVMLWKDWNLDFVPRLGPDEFARVRKTIHDLGMRFIVYTSPYYFLKGTPIENKAMNSFDNFAATGFPPGWPTGENMALFMAAISKVMRECRPDGLYFDGQYTDNPAALYALARHTRALIGESGILEWHSTGALGPRNCYLPHADAYVDFILRGEGEGKRYDDFDYMRFFISGYNINNCIGVVCNNGPPGLTSQLVREALKANARFHTIAGWPDDPKTLKVLQDDYRSRLTPELRRTVDEQVDARQAIVASRVKAARAEIEALRNPPAWDKPALSVDFKTIPDAKQLVSPKNTSPFSIVEDRLHIRAHANTYAYLRIPLNFKAKGFAVKVRQGTDQGQSWGPAAMIRWTDGAGLRIGTRSDGQLQTDILGRQTCGGKYDPSKWVWLRARWLAKRGVVERSDDGRTYERLWTFEHGGVVNARTTELLVGKVPYNGEPTDYPEAGGLGECDFEFVSIYADYVGTQKD
jgi:hypothetical protein